MRLYLSTCLLLYLCISMCLYISVYLSLCLCVCMCLYLTAYLSQSHSTSTPSHLLCAHLYRCVSLCLYVYSSTYLLTLTQMNESCLTEVSLCRSIYMPIHLRDKTHSCVQLSLSLRIYRPIHRVCTPLTFYMWIIHVTHVKEWCLTDG